MSFEARKSDKNWTLSACSMSMIRRQQQSFRLLWRIVPLCVKGSIVQVGWRPILRDVEVLEQMQWKQSFCSDLLEVFRGCQLKNGCPWRFIEGVLQTKSTPWSRWAFCIARKCAWARVRTYERQQLSAERRYTHRTRWAVAFCNFRCQTSRNWHVV